MRRNFAQILKSGKVDYKKEYKKLYELLFSGDEEEDNCNSVYAALSHSFTSFYFRGTYLSLQEFDEENGFNFPDPSQKDPKFNDLILLMEYFYNMLIVYQACAPYTFGINVDFYMQHILCLCKKIGYKQARQNGFFIFVKEDAVSTSVAESELIPDDLSYKLITYDHHSMHGNLDEKKTIIIRLSGLLEAQRGKLHQVNSGLESDLFCIFNNFNIRHNNSDSISKKYQPVMANMEKKELEKWYDETYQMCLLAFMELEHADRKPKIDAIKEKLDKK